MLLFPSGAKGDAGRSDPEERWALLVGIEKYQGSIAPCTGARLDVERLRDALAAHGGFSADRIITLVDGAATSTAITGAMRRIQSRARKSDAFLFYYSGHIVKDEKTSSFLTAAGSPGRKKGQWREAMAVTRLVGLVKGIPAARKILIADGWRNAPREGEEHDMGSSFPADFQILQSGKGGEGRFCASLAACEVGQTSHLHKEEGGGLLAWHLVKGLEGACADGEGRVTLSALGDYLGTAVPISSRQMWGERQAPWFDIEADGEATWVIAHRSGEALRRTGTLRIESVPAGADVRVDDVLRGATPLVIPSLPVGTRRLTLEKKDFEAFKTEVEVTFETVRVVSARLEARRGSLELTSTPPGGLVFLDGNFLGRTPLKTSAAPSGTHPLRVVCADRAWSGEITLDSAQAQTIAVTPDRPLIERRPDGTLINHMDGSVLVEVPQGDFIMGSFSGSAAEKPPRRISLGGFFIGRCEVTKGQFAAYIDAAGKKKHSELASELPEKAAFPVADVSYLEAQEYCAWARMRLPAEAEWEKAARGADGRAYPWGNRWDQRLCNNWQARPAGAGPDEPALLSGPGATPVGSFPGGASPWGCLDMAGSVWEWTSDLFRLYPGNTDTELDLPPPSYRVIRGGSWYLGTPDDLRCFARAAMNPKQRFFNIGFRVALSAP